MGISWIVEQVGSIMMAVTLRAEGIDELDGDKLIWENWLVENITVIADGSLIHLEFQD